METISNQDNMIFDMLALFDEQFDIVDFKNSVEENKDHSDFVLHKTKNSIEKAIGMMRVWKIKQNM